MPEKLDAGSQFPATTLKLLDGSRITIPEGKTTREVLDLIANTEGLAGEIDQALEEGALLPETAAVTFEVSDPGVRSVSATADFTEVRDVARVAISQDTDNAVTLLFDPEHDLEERIVKEQFLP